MTVHAARVGEFWGWRCGCFVLKEYRMVGVEKEKGDSCGYDAVRKIRKKHDALSGR